MRRCAACLLVAAAALLAPSLASGARVKPRIVAGTETSIEEVPFQVALYDPEAIDPEEPENLRVAQFCGGVIRDATHVITAAHCVTFGGLQAAAPEEIEVLAGSEELEEPGPQSIRDPVVATSFDPQWSPISGQHDIGVLTLEKPLWTGSTPEIDGSNAIAPIAFAKTPPTGGDKATVSGWGFTKALTPEQEPTEKEEEEGFGSTLQSAGVAVVSLSQCSADYEGLEEGLGPFGEDFVCAIGKAPTPTADACFGDSGGPLFSGPLESNEDRLLGLVDFGAGCGQQQLPGVYQSVISTHNAAFATSNPSQAPLSETAPAITGPPAPGQTIKCNPGSWLGTPTFAYRFYRDESTVLNPFAIKALTPGYSADSSYAVAGTDLGTRIFCDVVAANDGGVGQALSDEVVVAALPTPPIGIGIVPPIATPAPAVSATVSPPAPPTLRLVSSHCRAGGCSVNVQASKGTGAAAVTSVRATLNFTRSYPCRKHGRRATCRRRVSRRLTARATPGNHFVIFAGGLRPGAYTLTLLAIDRAGIHQTRPTRVALLLKRPSTGGR